MDEDLSISGFKLGQEVIFDLVEGATVTAEVSGVRLAEDVEGAVIDLVISECEEHPHLEELELSIAADVLHEWIMSSK